MKAKEVIEQLTLDAFMVSPEATEGPGNVQAEEVTEEATKEPETPDNDYFVENKETGKIELYFDKSTYMALDDKQKAEIKSNFLFSRKTGAWISRCKFPRLSWPRKIAEDLGLADAGKVGERLTFEEQQERKAERAEARADRYEAKADKAAAKGKALQAPIDRMHGDIAFFTQPNINTSAGRAFTRKRNRMWESWERGMDEFRKSEYYRERAEIARKREEVPTRGFCQRRIDEANKDIRALTKNIKAYSEKLEKMQNGEPIYNCWGEVIENPDPDNYAAEIDRWEEMLKAAIEKAAYYDALIQLQGGIIDRKTLKPGQLLIVERWGKVRYIKGGPKNFTFEFLQPNMTYANGQPMQGQASYAEIKEVC